jgi:hypothetical protein
LHVPDARLYEKAMHIFFADSRIYGRKKEFFAVEQHELDCFFRMLSGATPCSEKITARWEYAIQTAGDGSGRAAIPLGRLIEHSPCAGALVPGDGIIDESNDQVIISIFFNMLPMGHDDQLTCSLYRSSHLESPLQATRHNAKLQKTSGFSHMEEHPCPRTSYNHMINFKTNT